MVMVTVNAPQKHQKLSGFRCVVLQFYMYMCKSVNIIVSFLYHAAAAEGGGLEGLEPLPPPTFFTPTSAILIPTF